MVTWSQIKASVFPELITEFLTLHPTLDTPEKQPPRSVKGTVNFILWVSDNCPGQLKGQTSLKVRLLGPSKNLPGQLNGLTCKNVRRWD